ncbi:Ni/Fe hydrogenase subunit alpha [Candidatus Woesearchaeota archaeon]|nr:Ni/Fe hydrogenase subunit alpha [Candidatus Woesearchaeota archaeon]
MSKTIKLNHITKIEGHASLNLSIDKGKVKKCELSAVEGSRYFEGLLKGRRIDEASELTSRICGICSCAHTIAAIQAVENALYIKPSKQTIVLRELLTLGERIRSHATHLYFMVLPDYLGYESALSMLPKYKKEITIALKMMKIGNQIIKTVGGRDLHPVTATIGGFHNLPSQEELDELRKNLEEIKKHAVSTAKLFSGLDYPYINRKTEFFSLTSWRKFAMLYGNLKSLNKEYLKKDYQRYIKEYHTPYSSANFVVKDEKTYYVGALARINNNHKKLSKDSKKLLDESGMKLPNNNPFSNNIAQAIELVHSVDHAIEICSKLKIKNEKIKKYRVKAGHGVAAIEVPRGILWHEYKFNKKGEITYANIITPTAQNLRSMEEDIKLLLTSIINSPKKKIVSEIEKLIRAYDPCFSCSAHFLEVNWE